MEDGGKRFLSQTGPGHYLKRTCMVLGGEDVKRRVRVEKQPGGERKAKGGTLDDLRRLATAQCGQSPWLTPSLRVSRWKNLMPSKKKEKMRRGEGVGAAVVGIVPPRETTPAMKKHPNQRCKAIYKESGLGIVEGRESKM